MQNDHKIDIVFIQDNSINESIALTELAAVLKRDGHTYEVFIEREEKDILRILSESNPRVVMIPTSVVRPEWGLSTAEKIKSRIPDIMILLSGTYPTFFSDVIENEYVDMILLGEADYAVPELLKRMKAGDDITGVNNIWIKMDHTIHKNPIGLLTDLSTMPMPDREMYYKYKFIKNFPLKRFTSGRGCTNNCSYCFNPTFKTMTKGRGDFVRKKTAERTVEEILYIYKRYPLKHVHFSDDLFTYDKEWVLEFCERYSSSVGVPFTFNTMIDKLDEDIVNASKNAGCFGIAIGIESGKDDIRINILNKRITGQDIIETASLIKKHGIFLTTFNMIGNPGETLEDVIATIELNRRIKSDNPRISLSVPIHGTKLYNFAMEHGYIDFKDLEALSALFAAHKPVYKTPYTREFENLYYVFPLMVKYNFFSNTMMRYRSSKTLTPFLKLLGFTKLWYEKSFYNVGLIKGSMFYFHTGGLKNWTNLYSTII